MEQGFSQVDPTKDNVYPRFYIKPVKNNFKSAQEGREIYEDREYVEIIVPGDNRSVPNMPVNDEHRQRWPDKYKAFKEGRELPLEGTPIEQWSVLGPAQVMELKSSNIRTVEQLANLSDQQLKAAVPMGGLALRGNAIAFVEQAKGMAPITRLQADNDALRNQLAAQQAQIDQLIEQMKKGKTDEAAKS